MIPCFPLSQKIAAGSCSCIVSVLSQSCLCLVLRSRPAAIFREPFPCSKYLTNLRIKAFEIYKFYKVRSQKIYFCQMTPSRGPHQVEAKIFLRYILVISKQLESFYDNLTTILSTISQNFSNFDFATFKLFSMLIRVFHHEDSAYTG